MKKMQITKNSVFALLAMALLLSVCLVACSGGNGGEGESGSVSDSEGVSEESEQTVGTVLLPPISAKFVQSTDISYRADGRFVVELDPASAPADEIVMFYADDDGVMHNYSYLKKQPVGENQTYLRFTSVDSTLIPQGAKYIYVYTSAGGVYSEEHATVTLPEGVSDYDLGEKLCEFQVVSDIHIKANISDRNCSGFTAMLMDIARMSPDSVGIFANGDYTDSGIAEEYQNLQVLLDSVEGAPDLYIAAGNHDLPSSGPTLHEARTRFTEFMGVDKLYYDKWINGVHFIVLSSEDNLGVAYLSEDQLTWLDEKLKEDRDEDRPIFVFLHQGIYNTVAGTLPGQSGDGVGSIGHESALGKRLKSILARYPEAVLFSGHSHANLYSDKTMYQKDDGMCYAFNTAAVVGRSQGYYVEVYEGKLVLRGRNFWDGQWLPSATFVIDLSAE